MDNEQNAIDKKALLEEDAYATLTHDLEQLLAAAQPRLTRLALAQGVPPDGVEDVVQETLVHAWQRLAHLRAPDRFEAWLNGICRNMSMRWTRAQGTIDRRQHTFSSFPTIQENDSETPTGEIPMLGIPDPQMLDLTEELNRQDLAVLLDRAMSHLTAPTRQALEMYYFAEMSQHEIALLLGSPINALEVRLHRARRQLRQVLNGQLRADAEAFGLSLDYETATQEWRETSIWCCICGRRRLQGLFESQPEGDVSLRLRCPGCSPISGTDLIHTGHTVSFADVRSFRPAFKRVLQVMPSLCTQALAAGYQQCPACKQLAPFGNIEPEQLPAPFYRRLGIALACSSCGKSTSSIFSLCISYPPAYQFVLQHERCILEPEELVEYEGQAAIFASISDVLSSAQLTLILHRRTLQLLASFQT